MMNKPSPPGDTIKDIMAERGMSSYELAMRLGIYNYNVEMLLSGKFAISSDLARRLADTLGSTPEFWEERERQYREALKKGEP